jgi:hypothetical protein
MRYGRPQQTQIVGRVPIGVGLLAASLTGEVLAPARPKRAAARATLARRVRLPDLDANTGDGGLVGDDCAKLKEASARVVPADRLRNDRAPTHAGLLFATDPGTHLKRIFDDTFADGVVLRRLETSLLTRQRFHDRATTSSRLAGDGPAGAGKNLNRRGHFGAIGLIPIPLAADGRDWHGLYVLLILDAPLDDGQRCPTHGRNEVTVGPERRKAGFQLRKLVSPQPGRSPLNCLDHAMDSQRRIDIDQEVDVVRHDLGLDQDAVRFVSNFGTDLLEPPLDAIDQPVAPIFPTKDHVVPTRKDDVALRSGRHPGIHGNGLVNHQEGRALLPMAKAKGFARTFR